MRTYNAIIVDDEVNVLETLAILIDRNCPEINIVGKAKSAAEGRKLVKDTHVDLLFLDISMPKETGFDFLESIPRDRFSVIFTTAHEEYALKAIKANAIDYLLKPIDPFELKDAVEKATSLLTLRSQKEEAENTYNESLNNLTQQVKSGQSQLTKITVADKFGYRIIELDTIRFLEADNNYTIIHLSSFDKVVSSKSLGEYEKILDPTIFYRIHKSFLIDLNFLKGFSTYQGYFAIMDDNTKLSISRRRFNDFRELVESLTKFIDW